MRYACNGINATPANPNHGDCRNRNSRRRNSRSYWLGCNIILNPSSTIASRLRDFNLVKRAIDRNLYWRFGNITYFNIVSFTSYIDLVVFASH